MAVTYQPSPWQGPDGRRCLLHEGHPLMKVGYQGHTPDRAIRRPRRAAWAGAAMIVHAYDLSPTVTVRAVRLRGTLGGYG